MAGPELGSVQPEPGRRAGRQVLHHDIGGGDEPGQNLTT
jgi:hypothetical protein